MPDLDMLEFFWPRATVQVQTSVSIFPINIWTVKSMLGWQPPQFRCR